MEGAAVLLYKLHTRTLIDLIVLHDSIYTLNWKFRLFLFGTV